MTTARSTQGLTVRIDDESALGTAGGNVDKDIRLAAAPTIPMATRALAEQPNIGHENALDVSDKPIPYEMAVESGLTLPINIRRGATTSSPPLWYMCKSGAFAEDISSDARVDDVGAAVGDWDADANVFGDTSNHYGKAILVKMTNDLYYPALLASFTHATLNSIPMMDLPAAPENAAGTIKRMYNMWIDPSAVAATDTLQVVYTNRGEYNTAPDLSWTLGGCSMADLGEIAINKEGAVVINPTFHVADVDVSDEGDLNAASFLEGDTSGATTSHLQRQESSNFRFEIAPYAAAGGITAATHELISATIRPNATTIPIVGIGDTDTVNGIQGYMGRVTAPECDVTFLLDHDYIDDASKGIEAVTGNQDTYLGFVWQSSTLNIPAYGMWLPRCYQYAPPDIDPFNDEYIKMTCHFRADAPKYTGSSTGNGSSGMSPFIMAVHGQAT